VGIIVSERQKDFNGEWRPSHFCRHFCRSPGCFHRGWISAWRVLSMISPAFCSDLSARLASLRPRRYFLGACQVSLCRVSHSLNSWRVFSFSVVVFALSVLHRNVGFLSIRSVAPVSNLHLNCLSVASLFLSRFVFAQSRWVFGRLLVQELACTRLGFVRHLFLLSVHLVGSLCLGSVDSSVSVVFLCGFWCLSRVCGGRVSVWISSQLLWQISALCPKGQRSQFLSSGRIVGLGSGQ
jgi:hypothetical protein